MHDAPPDPLATLERRLAEAARALHHSANQTMECVQEIKRCVDAIDALRRSQDTANVINEGWKGAHEAQSRAVAELREALLAIGITIKETTGEYQKADLEDRKSAWKWLVKFVAGLPTPKMLAFLGFLLVVIALLAKGGQLLKFIEMLLPMTP